MLKRICLIIVIAMGVVVFSINNVNAFSAKAHVDQFKSMHKVPLKYGGLGGEENIPFRDLEELQATIDCTKSPYHRHDGSHSLDRVKGLQKVISGRWNARAVMNAFIIHNIADMAHSGNGEKTGGTNGWKWNEKRAKKARELLDKIDMGKKIKAPKWAKKTGKEVIIKQVKKFVVSNTAKNVVYKSKFGKAGEKVIETIAPKLKIVVQNTPEVIARYGGPIIVVIFEGAEIYRDIAENGFDLTRQIDQITSSAISTIVAGIVAKYTFAALAPAEAIPIPFVGPIVHIGGTILISGAAGYYADQIVDEIIDYIDIQYIS